MADTEGKSSRIPVRVLPELAGERTAPASAFDIPQEILEKLRPEHLTVLVQVFEKNEESKRLVILEETKSRRGTEGIALFCLLLFSLVLAVWVCVLLYRAEYETAEKALTYMGTAAVSYLAGRGRRS